MEKVTVIKASEQEIVDLIQEHICKDYDSIVAAEEIGNQDWTTSVGIPDYMLVDIKELKEDYMFRTSDMMDVLCQMGHLEAGDYVIDCKW